MVFFNCEQAFELATFFASLALDTAELRRKFSRACRLLASGTDCTQTVQFIVGRLTACQA